MNRYAQAYQEKFGAHSGKAQTLTEWYFKTDEAGALAKAVRTKPRAVPCRGSFAQGV
jgi:negative regulator of replication initiation